MKKYGYILAGIVFTILGIVGVFLPIMPAIPFFLAAVYYFSKASKRFRAWFMSTELYRRYFQNFIKNRAMPVKAKIIILVYLAIAVAAVFIFSTNIYAKISAAAIAAVMYYYFLFAIKNAKRQSEK